MLMVTVAWLRPVIISVAFSCICGRDRAIDLNQYSAPIIRPLTNTVHRVLDLNQHSGPRIQQESGFDSAADQWMTKPLTLLLPGRRVV